MSFTVRMIQKDDLPSVARLETLCFAEPWSEHALELLLSDGALGVVAVSDGGEVLAYGGMLLAPDEGQITNIATHPDFRRLGAGRQILRALIREANNRSLSTLALEVRESNLSAIRLYESEGFSVMGRRKRFYKNPAEDALVMLRNQSDNI